jgi:hypothetical protein
VAVHNNIAYIFGGFDAANVIDNTFIFDISQTPGSRITAGPPINLLVHTSLMPLLMGSSMLLVVTRLMELPSSPKRLPKS